MLVAIAASIPLCGWIFGKIRQERELRQELYAELGQLDGFSLRLDRLHGLPRKIRVAEDPSDKPSPELRKLVEETERLIAETRAELALMSSGTVVDPEVLDTKPRAPSLIMCAREDRSMVSPSLPKQRVASGVSQLDRLLGGLFIGDNVVWHDDAGSLASVFCLSFLQTSEAQEKPIIYVSFDRSPRNLLEKLGHLADYRNLTILDCFTWGKGAGSDVFLRFYRDPRR